MSKNLTDRFFDSVRVTMRNFSNNAQKIFEEYDIASTPAFLMFLVVTTAGMTINYFFLREIVDDFEAFAISMLFELGIMAWKFQSHRVKNSAAQAQVVNWAMWLSVILAFAMLISSLTQRVYWGWIVAVAALTHVVAYLIFDQNDDMRNNRRANKQSDERLFQKNFVVDSALKEAEADLKIIHKITSEITRLRNENAHLPKDELEFVLEATRKRLLREYKASENVSESTKGLSDVDKDGKIGGNPI